MKIDGRIGNGPRMDPLSGLSDNGAHPKFFYLRRPVGVREPLVCYSVCFHCEALVTSGLEGAY